ncbi:hypothetical protein M422DRAFT_160058, partial [Sphaerobolus stellatus SS14]
VSNQKDIVTSFASLLRKVDGLVKLADEISKIHPYVNFAWQVLSAGFKMVKAQQLQDQKISALVTTMEDIYAFTASVDKFKDGCPLQAVVTQILTQTIECGFFIQEYARNQFAARALKQPFSGTDELIDQFCAEFKRLRANFDSGVNIATALVLSQTALTIDSIRRDQVLSKLQPVSMDEYNRRPCIPNTRLNVIKSITDWIADDSRERKTVLWLYGLAGSGKSTLSTTVAQTMRDLQRLGAFFYFDRSKSEKDAASLIRTLAYQLALANTHIGDKLTTIVENNPNIVSMPFEFQFSTLLSAKALNIVDWRGGPIVLVIDALDECGNEKGREPLMQALLKGFAELPPFIRLLVVSRPEADIRRKLGPHFSVYPYHLNIDSEANMKDIPIYLQRRFSEIRNAQEEGSSLDSDWPGSDSLSVLAQYAAGLFVWASTACLYIEAYDPKARLIELLDQELKTTTSEPFAGLDHLYKIGLQSTGKWNIPSFASDCCNILGIVLSARDPLSCSAIDSLLGLQTSSIQVVSKLGCVLRGSHTEAVRTLHPSFQDYLSNRCSGEAWSINIEEYNQRIAVCCINFLDNNLHENICGLSLENDLWEPMLPEALSYASRYWIEHIIMIPSVGDDIGNRIHGLLDNHLLHWIEALAVLKRTDLTIRLLENLLNWLKRLFPDFIDLHNMVYDAHRFAQYFANSIEEHPLTGAEILPPLQGHNDSVWSVAFSQDGSKIVSGSSDKTIRVWDASTGAEILPPLQGHNGLVLSVAFSQDGSKIVSGSDDNTIRVWDASTGAEILPPLQGHNDLVLSVAFSQDGLKIVSGSDDKTIRVWDANTGAEILPPLQGHNDSVQSVAFSQDGSKIVSGSDDKTIQVWDASTGAEILPPLQGHNDWVQSVAFSQDGLKIVSGSDDKTIRVWDVNTGAEILPPLQGHNDWVQSVAFSQDGPKIVSGSSDKTIRVWDASTGAEILPPLQGHNGSVQSVAFSQDGSKIVSGSYDKTVRVWDASTGAEILPPLQCHNDSVWSVAFSQDGSKIVSGSYDKTIRVWNASTGAEILPPLQGHNDLVWSVAFSQDGSKIVSGSSDKTIRVWDASTGAQILPPLQGHNDLVWSVAFSQDGSKIVSRSYDETIQVWDASTGAEILLPISQNNAHNVFMVEKHHISLKNRWFLDTKTGARLGRLPVEFSSYAWYSLGSRAIGWTAQHKIVIIDFTRNHY